MIYLTVNDAPSGVFKSQVVDVVIEMNSFLDEEIKLVVLLSFRNFKENKAKIKAWYPNAVVKKMIPGLANWKKNKLILGLVAGIKKEKIIARGPMAYELAFALNKSVIYDGRGAVKAELEEFPSMIPDKKIVTSIIQAEKNAVETAVYKIAVSSKLVEYWRSTYNYKGDNHIIIPCTLSNSLIYSDDQNRGEKITLVYAGSTAGWQSFEKVSGLIRKFIIEQDIEVLFLSEPSSEIDALIKEYPNAVKMQWVDHKDVYKHLALADYGILIRDENLTNYVASPVKFAEYLVSGLKVLISPNLGDYSELVEKENLGVVLSNDLPQLTKVTLADKKRIREYAIENFSKKAFQSEYKRLLQ